MQMKDCGHCKKSKPIQEFGKDIATKSKLRSACKDCEHLKRRKHYLQNRSKRIESSVRWAKKNREKFLWYMRDRRRLMRKMVIEAYGSKCRCCGEKIMEFLTIEHPLKDGKAHRKKCGSADGVYRDIIKRKFPSDYFLLCCNCNYAERYGKKCPHRQAEGK